MVCEFGPKFPACTKVQQSHLRTRTVKGMLGVHQCFPLSVQSGLGPSFPPHTLSPPAKSLPSVSQAPTSGLHASNLLPYEDEESWLLFFWS